ncbi:BTB/POZ and MATH domain-containing protein 1-like [Lolium rigidum]|uniref:BTB/POZ and MATH domain-containing protein 1-like n=1 Tax=Lolium rigidum TaxID=89674 RepID=UPI001F5CBB98|nr:BTB/POZ and MATH domain-containing protein 1-like [Lolium rigidum]
MSKDAKKTGPEVQTRITKVGSSFQFRIDYEQTKQLPIGESVHSDVFSVGGHNWRIECYPRGVFLKHKGEYLSIYLKHMSRTRSVKAIFEAFMMDKDGKPCTEATRRSHVREFSINNNDDINDDNVDWGWSQFVKGTTLENDYITEGHITIMCGIVVIHDSPILVPPSDIGIHLGSLLDHTDGTDVSFTIDGETFRAHRAVLAARSPVFRAELFGSMAESTMKSISVHEITPATFEVMLRFIYTDAMPGEDELGDSSSEILQDLLAAADRYALDRLKLMCAQKLCDKVSTDTVATTLACAETYNCPELKSKCIDFLAVQENFHEAVFTEGYALLVLKFPSITAELRKRVRT